MTSAWKVAGGAGSAGVGVIRELRRGDHFGETEIDQLEMSGSIDHAIRRLDIPMNDAKTVDVIQCQHKLREPQTQDFDLWFVSVHHLLQIPSTNVRHDEVDDGLVDHAKLEADHIGVLNLLEDDELPLDHLRNGRVLFPWNGFDCVLFACVEVEHQMHRPVPSSPQQPHVLKVFQLHTATERPLDLQPFHLGDAPPTLSRAR